MGEYTKLADIFHTLACTKPHSDNMLDLLKERSTKTCYYYLEESLAGEEDKPDHAYWEAVARELCSKAKLSPEEYLRVIPQLLDLRRRLEQVVNKNVNVRELARLILFDEPF